METFTEYCKNYIKDHLNEFEGQTLYASDLAYTLTQEPNTNGSLTYSSAKAKEYLREWWDECGGYWDYEKDNFGEHTHNPFDEPEAYMVCMVIEGVNALLQGCDIITNKWNDHIELTKRNIKKIIDQVDEQTDIEF